MKDEVKQEGKWEFNEEVTKVFTDMISRSIPDYENMRYLSQRMAMNFVEKGTIADIGCSNGLGVEAMVKALPNNPFILTDVSEPMLEECRKKYVNNKNVWVMNHDLRKGVMFEEADVCMSCLTLQFTPIEYRQNILMAIYDGLREGGALILVEKVIGNSCDIDNMLIDEYYNIKRENGYTEELIQAKRKSLEGSLVPLTSDFDVSLLKTTGFKAIDCFWRYLNFCGWVAIK